MDPNRIATAPELHKAAEADRSDLVLSLLKRGADLEYKDARGWTALNTAAFFGNPGVVMTLLAAKANIEATTRTNSYTALHTAADKGHLAVVELLLWKGADITALTGRGWTVLNLAVYAGHYDVVSSLLIRGANIRATTAKGGWTVLHTAADRGNVPLTLLLLGKGADIKAVTKKGMNALHCGAYAGHVQVIRTLLDQKADVYSATQSSTYTALHFAAEKAYPGVLRLLLDGGADPLALTKDGQTASDLLSASEKAGFVTSKQAVQSCRQQLQDSINRVLEGTHSYGKKIRASASDDQIKLRHFLDDVHANTAGTDSTPLHWAILANDGSISRILLENGADVSRTDGAGWTALLCAANFGESGILQQLLAHGADIAATSRNLRWTALHLAAENNHVSTVRILLDGGADALALTKNGETALDVTPKSDTAIRNVLQKAMAVAASQAKHPPQVLPPPTIRESPAPSLDGIRSSPAGETDDIIPRDLFQFIPEADRERIRSVWTSRRERPSPLYDPKEFLERIDTMLSQDAFRELTKQARSARMNSNGDKVSHYCLCGVTPG